MGDGRKKEKIRNTKIKNKNNMCFEPFTRAAPRLDGLGPFTRQNIEYVGQAHLLDKKLSKQELGPSAR